MTISDSIPIEPGEVLELPDIEDLLKLAEVTEADIQAAIEDWKKNPADREFKNLLDSGS